MAEDAGEEIPLQGYDEAMSSGYVGGEVAMPVESNSLGLWDGDCFFLRTFPVWYRWWQVSNSDVTSGRPESGSINGVQFEQSMGRIVLWFPLEGADAELTESDFLVELSTWELRVSVTHGIAPQGKNTGRKIEALSGELFGDIRRSLSWWDLTQDDAGDRWLAIYLFKSLHKAWKGPWYEGPLNPHRKMVFGWTPWTIQPEKTQEDKLTPLSPGPPQDLDKALCTGMSAERVCTGIDAEEDEAFAVIIVHLDEEAVEVATDRVPMEELFAADVRHGSLQIYMRNDGFGLCSANLRGGVAPELSTWEFTNIRRRELPKGSTIRCPAFFNPALRIKLAKAPGSQYLWGGVFADVSTPTFDLPRERMSWTERLQRALVLSPGAPLKQQVKTSRAQRMCTKVDCSQDTVTQRAMLTLHLDEALEELSMKFKLDLTTFFALKVGERLLEVSVIADAEFTMCVGRLGGAVDPGKTSWEIARERNAPGDEKEHLVLKISLAKAAGSKERWDEVFSRMEPWEVSESLRGPAALADGGDEAIAAEVAAATGADGEAGAGELN